MHREHWLERWQQNRIGFHQDQINLHLVNFWSRLGAAKGSRVFVPLCGKSLDMLWLREQGYEVLGVEISPIAVQDFFTENNLEPERQQVGAFERYRVAGLTLLCGDFFDLRPTDLEEVAVVYDRASLIALPASMREDYARHFDALFPQGVETLLITMEYPQEEMAGPPFCVPQEEVHRLYAARYGIEVLYELDILAENPGFRQRGLSRLVEKVYHLQV